MSMHDNTLIFFNSYAIAAASTEYASKIIDSRFNGGLDLKINARIVNMATGDAVSLTLQDSEDGETWNDRKTYTSNAEGIIAAESLPEDLARYWRLVATGTQGAVVFAEVTDTVDKDASSLRIQDNAWRDQANPVTDDAAEADAVRTANPPGELD